MKPSRLAVALLLPLSVAACGVPDIVAHGVKAYERSQEPGQQQPAAQPASYQPAAQPARPATTGAEPDFVPAAAPPRESVTAEPLR
ncbi:MAG TPA: hypothetical protein VL974_07930 [Magnetospirillum sp.]|jgi:hypothetical protein|nr:hypothetical protein [Magnetospirillum sp.]